MVRNRAYSDVARVSEAKMYLVPLTSLAQSDTDYTCVEKSGYPSFPPGR